MGKESVESVAAQGGYEILNRTSTRRVNAAILDGDVPVYAVNGPAIVLAGPSVSVLMRGGEYAVGIGCRKGVTSAEVVDAIKNALNEQSLSLDDVFAYATTDKKIHEQGLSDAVRTLSAGLIFLDDKTINGQDVHSQSKASRIGLLGVAEPCALALAKKKELLMKKTVFGRVTIAIAR
jgi:cobalt-precorrin 5A hydrolase